MNDFLTLLLGLAAVAGLVLIPFGLPGLWVIVLSVAAYGWLEQFSPPITWEFIALIIGLVLVADAMDAWAHSRLREHRSHLRRARWSALIGGSIGAIAGAPLTLIGSVVGGVVGSFLGGLLFEYARHRRAGEPPRLGMLALLGRAAIVALKPAVAVAMIATATFAAFTSSGQWQGS